MDYTAIGGAVNIASRLEGVAKDGSILVSDATFSLICELVRTGPRQRLSLKGIQTPLPCREIIGLLEPTESPQVAPGQQSVQLLR